ncbi:MAG: alanine--tRNA ligase, partial [Comamonadaceae bacterium]
VESIDAGQAAIVVLDATPFYAESGGQVGDQGVLEASTVSFEVHDTQKIQPGVFGHHGTLASGTLRVGDAVQARVDVARRARTARNHSATHLLHKALRLVLGNHVQQRGSLVDPDKTRFDFAQDAPMSAQQIAEVESIVNAEVLLNQPTESRVMGYDEAVQGGATALFGEKYGDKVRVIDIGFSRELCGGTHVLRTGDIGLFKVVSEGGVAAGVRRVEAITGDNALAWVQGQAALITQAAAMLKSVPADLPERIAGVQDQVKALEKELAQLRAKAASNAGTDLASRNVIEVKGVKVLAANVGSTDPKALRGMVDQIKNTLKSAVVLLASEADGKISVVGGVTADLTARIKAGDLVGYVSSQVGGKGGGRPDMAMGGGSDMAALPAAVASVQGWVNERL